MNSIWFFASFDILYVYVTNSNCRNFGWTYVYEN